MSTSKGYNLPHLCLRLIVTCYITKKSVLNSRPSLCKMGSMTIPIPFVFRNYHHNMKRDFVLYLSRVKFKNHVSLDWPNQGLIK